MTQECPCRGPGRPFIIMITYYDREYELDHESYRLPAVNNWIRARLYTVYMIAVLLRILHMIFDDMNILKWKCDYGKQSLAFRRENR